MTRRVLGRLAVGIAAVTAVLVMTPPSLPDAAAALAQPPATGQAPASPAQPPAPSADETQPVFRSGVQLVLVDVSVTGEGDEPLTDLSPADFELTEDGVPQVVEQATLVRLDAAPRGDGEALEIRSPAHAIAEAARDDVRLFAVFMDDYHLGRFPQEMLPLRKGLADFLGSMMGPLDLVTVMNPITPLSALEWTRDRAGLVREIKTYEGRNDNFIGRSPIEESQGFSRNIARVRSQVVITALQALVMHLSGLREGRKTLLFVSQGIPLLFDISLESDFQAILREANRGNVIIHTLDPRGLGQGTRVHDTLFRMASETGGHAVVNTNDISKGLEKVGTRRQPLLPHRLRAHARAERRQVPPDLGEGEPPGRPHRGPPRLLGAIGRGDESVGRRAARTRGVERVDESPVAAGRPRGARRNRLRARRRRRRAPLGHVAAGARFPGSSRAPPDRRP